MTIFHSQQMTTLFKDASIAVLSGATQNALPEDYCRRFLCIENDGNANVGVNFSGPSTGGTGPGGVGNDATIGSTGTLTIVPFGSLLFDLVVPQNVVNVSGTAGQSVTIVVASL